MLRRHATLALAAAPLASLLARRAFAQAEGRDFTLLDPPQAVAVPAGKVEVVEFFSYACPHCFAFEPVLEPWVKALPPQVVFRRVPVPFLYNFQNLQPTYYALEQSGLVDAVHGKVFSAIHVEKQRLDKPDDIAALVARNGGDAAKFSAALKSFSVATAVSRAKKMVADYKVNSVPTLVVQGRFVTSPEQAGGAQNALAVCSALIERAKKG